MLQQYQGPLDGAINKTQVKKATLNVSPVLSAGLHFPQYLQSLSVLLHGRQLVKRVTRSTINYFYQKSKNDAKKDKDGAIRNEVGTKQQ